MANLPPLSPALKSLQPYLRTAAEHDTRDPIIAYWCRLYTLQAGLNLDRKSKESLAFLMPCMDWLEKTKIASKENEGISNEVVAQAHVENYALKLFLWADAEDRAGRFNKNVVKAFYTAGIIFDILVTFGELSEEVQHQQKYAKWKATYIHNCLKNGVTPEPGPHASEEEGFDWKLPTPPSASSGAAGSSEGNHTLPYPNMNNVGNDTDQDSSHLGVFVPGSHAPPSTPSGSNHPSPSSSRASFESEPPSSCALNRDKLNQAQKFCKWAGSALQYEDIPTAIDNLQKALALLTNTSD